MIIKKRERERAWLLVSDLVCESTSPLCTNPLMLTKLNKLIDIDSHLNESTLNWLIQASN